MPGLQALPVDVVANVALYLWSSRTDSGDWQYGDRDQSGPELLALRCVCRAGADAVRRAVKQHVRINEVRLYLLGAKAIAAKGRVYGGGCKSLIYCSNGFQFEAVNALRTFVANTQGHLRQIHLGTSYSVGTLLALDLCRACPELTRFSTTWSDADGVASVDVDAFAAELGRACPSLEAVILCKSNYAPIIDGLSPAESYQRHFPATKCLDFNIRNITGGGQQYEPTRYDEIRKTLRVCVCADEVDLGNCTVSLALMDLLLSTPLRSRLRKLTFGLNTFVAPETILRCAAACEALTALELPSDFSEGAGFYRSLVAARPTLKKFDLCLFGRIDDECLRILCNGLSLERLKIPTTNSLTQAAADIIIGSPCSRTLRSIDAGSFDDETTVFTSAHVLRLLRSCPLISELDWLENGHLSAMVDGDNVDAINKLLKSRGGYEVDVLEHYGPVREGH